MAVSVAAIKVAVTDHFNLPAIEMVSRRTGPKTARPRQIAMALAYELTPLSYPEIGREFQRDHTTIMHAVRVVAARSADPDFAAIVDGIRKRITTTIAA